LEGYAGAADTKLPSPDGLESLVVDAISVNIEGGFLSLKYELIYMKPGK